MSQFQSDKSNKLLIIDDLMSRFKNLVDVFYKGCYHWNMTLRFILLNICF